MKLKHMKLKHIFKKKGKYNSSNVLWGYLMISPYFIGAFIFSIMPILFSAYYSLTKWGAFGGYEFLGINNYFRLFNDAEFYISLKNTFIFAGLTTPISIAIGIIVAVLLNQKIKGLTLFRTLYFLPVVTMPAAISMVWKWLYNGDYGLINYLLGLIGIEGLSWLSNPDTALYAIILVAIWSTIGYNMIILLSGLQGIPQTLYEAAEIDGANGFTQFFRITLPLLTPTIFFVSVISVINSLKVFDLIFMMINRESFVIENAQSVVYHFYKTAFIINEKGYASAILVVLFLIILILTIVQNKLQSKWVHYN